MKLPEIMKAKTKPLGRFRERNWRPRTPRMKVQNTIRLQGARRHMVKDTAELLAELSKGGRTSKYSSSPSTLAAS